MGWGFIGEGVGGEWTMYDVRVEIFRVKVGAGRGRCVEMWGIESQYLV